MEFQGRQTTLTMLINDDHARSHLVTRQFYQLQWIIDRLTFRIPNNPDVPKPLCKLINHNGRRTHCGGNKGGEGPHATYTTNSRTDEELFKRALHGVQGLVQIGRLKLSAVFIGADIGWKALHSEECTVLCRTRSRPIINVISEETVDTRIRFHPDILGTINGERA